MDETTPDRLRRYREDRALSLQSAAEKISVSWQSIQKLEKDRTTLSWEWAKRLARAYDMDPREVMFGDTTPTVPVVGYVGAGSEVFPINDHEPGDGIYRAKCPEGLNPETTEAVVVRGDSMLPIDDGWILFYSREATTGRHLIGNLCIVELDDGRGLIKQVRRGYSEGRFNLISTNAAPIEDVVILWGARMRAALPPDVALRNPDDNGDQEAA